MARWDDEEFNTMTPPTDIQCTTCKHRLPPVTVGEDTFDRSGYGMCDMFEYKPQGVLWNHDTCDKYEEE